MGYEYLRQIADMAKAIEQQDRMNEKNVSSFLERLENAIEYDIGLNEDVWADTEISSASSMIFGWCKVDSGWHITIAQRDTYRDPDSDEEYVYGQFPQPILNAGSAQQREVFFKANLLIAEIHKHLTNRYESSKGTGEEITAKIKEVDALLK